MDMYKKSLETLSKIIENQKKMDYEIYIIGGWAVWAYNPYLKSKDIDFIIKEKDYYKLKDFILSLGFKETSGEHLNKKGFSMLWEDDKIEIDVYTDKVSKFDIDKLLENPVKRKINNKEVSVINISNLVMLKFYTASERFGTAKGEKDLSDLLALIDRFYLDIDWENISIDKEVINILFKDFKQSSKIYPIEFDKFNKIKKYLKEVGLIE